MLFNKRLFCSQIKLQSVRTLDYKQNLCNLNANNEEAIEQSFGPKGFGILFVKNIPNFVDLRLQLLKQSFLLANLDEDKLKKLEHPESFYTVGWSRGKEKFQGKYDYSKGGFYANPLQDNNKFNNIWPKEDLPLFELYYKQLGQVMYDVGLKMASQLDSYIEKRSPTYEKGKLSRVLNHKESTIGRLLYYYPSYEKDESNWCGWHNDHSAITCLTAGIFQDQQGNIVKNPDPESGLYAKNRYSEIIKIQIPQDCLAIQIGESAQIFSGGILEATPHCVVQGKGLQNTGISRSSFPIFLGPQGNEKMKVPEGINPQQAINKDTYNVPSLENRWNPETDDFDSFGSKTVQAYHD